MQQSSLGSFGFKSKVERVTKVNVHEADGLTLIPPDRLTMVSEWESNLLNNAPQ